MGGDNTDRSQTLPKGHNCCIICCSFQPREFLCCSVFFKCCSCDTEFVSLASRRACVVRRPLAISSSRCFRNQLCFSNLQDRCRQERNADCGGNPAERTDIKR